MSNEVLKDLLKEYEQKRLKAEYDLEKRKEKLYALLPRLSEIDDELNNTAIKTAKNILNNSSNTQDNDYIQNLKNKISSLKLEKDNILKQNNLSPNYLKPFYDCKICNDTGYVTDLNYNTTMCSCLKQRLLDISFNKSNMYNLKKENFANFDERLYSDEPDLSKYKLNISPRKNILNIKNKCLEFITHFDDPNYKNLLFTGSTGLR